MSGYRCVNYYDLCRLCTTSNSTNKINIFSQEGRKKNLSQKIAECLPIMINEKDRLPKIICIQCVQQVESIVEFRNSCRNSEAMLESCLSTATLQNGGKVYIKESSKNTYFSNDNVAIAQQQQQQQQQQQTQAQQHQEQPQQQLISSNVSNDFLSSIIQAVGIQQTDEFIDMKPKIIPQYTVTLDGKSSKTGQIEYKVEENTVSTTIHSEKQAKQNALAEFLKMKPNIKVTPIKRKDTQLNFQPQLLQQSHQQQNQQQLQQTHQQQQLQQTHQQQQPQQTIQQPHQITITANNETHKRKKYNLVLTSPTQPKPSPIHIQQQPSFPQTISNSINLQDMKILSPNKCYLPITIKDGNSDQQIVAHIDAKNFVLPTTYQLQMKLQPQISTVDGQTVMQLTPATVPSSLQIASQTLQQNQNTNHFITTGIDAATSTNDTEIIFTNQVQCQTTAASEVAIQPISAPKYQITTIPTTVATTSSIGTTSSTINAGSTFQNQQHGAITVQRINQQTIKTKQFVTKLPTNTGLTVSRIPNIQQQQSQQIQQTQHQQQQQQPQQQQNVLKTKKVQQTQKKTSATANKHVVSNVNSPATSNNNDSKLECNVCGRSFKKKEHLSQHVKLHAGLRPFKCAEDGCSKSFNRKEHLMRHIVSHTGKKMFSCDLCQKLFSRKDNLNKHKRTHTDQSANNTQFVCDICNKSFAVKMYYVQHKLMHEKENEIAVPEKTIEPADHLVANDLNQIKMETQIQHIQPQQQMVQFHISSPVSSADLSRNTITITQTSDQQNQTSSSVLKSLGSHDTTVLNLPSSLANFVNLNSAQFVNAATGEIMGHIKIEK